MRSTFTLAHRELIAAISNRDECLTANNAIMQSCHFDYMYVTLLIQDLTVQIDSTLLNRGIFMFDSESISRVKPDDECASAVHEVRRMHNNNTEILILNNAKSICWSSWDCKCVRSCGANSVIQRAANYLCTIVMLISCGNGEYASSTTIMCTYHQTAGHLDCMRLYVISN